MIFVSCNGCREPMLAVDRLCPHCGVDRESPRRAGAAIMILGALTGCFPIGEPAYGIADSGTSEWGDTSESASESMSTTYDGPYTTTTSPGTTRGTSPTPDPTNYTMGDSSSDESESTGSTGDTGSSSDGSASSESSGSTDESSSSDDGASSDESGSTTGI